MSVVGIHLFCRGGLNVVDLGEGRFETRSWLLHRPNLKAEQVYVALHESYSEPSYRQGVLVGWADDESNPDRVVLTVRGTATPLAWGSGGSREKRIATSDEPDALRNRSLVFGPQRYLARICWNSEGWRWPTGEGRGLEEEPSFVNTHGFGHEEWLFNGLWELDSWRYGFLQPVNRVREQHQGEIIDVGLYTIDPERHRLLAGRIRRAEVLTEPQALSAWAEFEKRGLLTKMREEVTAVGGDVSTLAQKPTEFIPFNIRFRAQDVEIADPPEPAPRDHRVWTLNRYVLTAAPDSDLLRENHLGTRKLRPERFDPREPTGPTQIEARHNQIQNRLFDLLDKRYGDAVVMEKNHVDIVVDHPVLHAFVEVKSDPEARVALRNAIGQLLEYVWYERPDARRPELFVAAPAPLTAAAKAYLDRIREKEGLTIRYVQVTVETRTLPAALER